MLSEFSSICICKFLISLILTLSNKLKFILDLKTKMVSFLRQFSSASPPPPPPPPPPPTFGPNSTNSVLNTTSITIRMNDTPGTYERDSLRMLRRLALFLMTLSLLFFILGRMTKSSEPYGYLVLSKHWSPAKCLISNQSHCLTSGDVSMTGSKWLIGGLWAKLSNRTCKRTFCSKSPFEPSEVALLKPALLQRWPSIATTSSMKDHFEPNTVNHWAEEWIKHGTCSQLDQFTYFARALSLDGCIQLSDYLEEHGIVPTFNLTYSEPDFKEALRHHLSANSLKLECEQYEGRLYLTEIRLCISASATQSVIPCPTTLLQQHQRQVSSCYDQFYYIP